MTNKSDGRIIARSTTYSYPFSAQIALYHAKSIMPIVRRNNISITYLFFNLNAHVNNLLTRMQILNLIRF